MEHAWSEDLFLVTNLNGFFVCTAPHVRVVYSSPSLAYVLIFSTPIEVVSDVTILLCCSEYIMQN